ncbi:hypothetical protein GF337_01370 [candidate division KSB1 bacterium]|nr:hypothetical protein [candidate division KSB1 bacterium]
MASKPDKFVPAIIGGIVIGVLSTVPVLNFINCFCCAGVIIGGFTAVYVYNKTLGEQELIYSDGALLGILAGIIGVVFSAILNSIFGITMEKVLEQAMQFSQDIPPEAEEMLNFFRQNQSSLYLLNIAMSLVINVLFGLAGGLLGVAILGKKK